MVKASISKLKMTLCTTPIRPVPTGFPPLGSMAIIQSLRAIDVDCNFYNIDYFRYSEQEIKDYFRAGKFHIVAISAVVSTAYVYTKYLASLIKKCLPEAIVVVGGNLAASAEVLLRKTDVDICIVGDGEFIIQDLVSLIASEGNKIPKADKLDGVKGICFINESDKFIFTGYGRKPTSEEIEYPDYKILEKDNSLPYFITKNEMNALHEQAKDTVPKVFRDRWDPNGYTATVISAKGCVARCTFCHRWEKGYRVSPIDKLMSHIDDLNKNYGVTHIDFGDENFGADRKFTRELVKRLGEKGYTWEAGGVRVRTVNFDDLKLWGENGCRRVIYGIETGSEKMLSIMEKNATLQENLNALKWLSDLKIPTVTQFVIGMPGENDKTIYETVDFLKKISDFSWDWKNMYPSELISLNYAQALPGTPLYEYAREKGFIGIDVNSEEQYLIKISDTDAYSEDHFMNYISLPLLKVLAWRTFILTDIDAYHATNKLGIKNLSIFEVISYYLGIVFYRISKKLPAESFLSSLYSSVLEKFKYNKPEYSKDLLRANNEDFESDKIIQEKIDTGYFNIQSYFKFAPLLLNRHTKIFYKPAVYFYVAFFRSGSNSKLAWLRLFYEYFTWLVFPKNKSQDELTNKSLRKVVKITQLSRDPENQNNMTPLRAGR